jgi:hypothetical protein
MAKKQFYAIIDTETCKDDSVADIGIVICDRHGNIVKSMGVLIGENFCNKELFYDPSTTGFWGKAAADKRKAAYQKMVNDGTRMIASVAAVNKWINQAIGSFNPEATAYNLAFDRDKCQKSGIDLSGFKSSFCLWQAAVGSICLTKDYKNFVLQNHGFNAPTELGNMSIKTNAEMVAGYLGGAFVTEPHTALEDARDFELPILRAVLKKKGWRDKIKPYNWRDWQVKNHFNA